MSDPIIPSQAATNDTGGQFDAVKHVADSVARRRDSDYERRRGQRARELLTTLGYYPTRPVEAMGNAEAAANNARAMLRVIVDQMDASDAFAMADMLRDFLAVPPDADFWIGRAETALRQQEAFLRAHPEAAPRYGTQRRPRRKAASQ